MNLPTSTAAPTQYYVHNAYDPVGNLLWNSLPVTAASAGSMPADSKTQTSIDMGARRFGPATARFLQRDNYQGATADLGLALDPLTQNRYALASGNPISFVEWDGHVWWCDPSGGLSRSAPSAR